jgi:hypothetical protein
MSDIIGPIEVCESWLKRPQSFLPRLLALDLLAEAMCLDVRTKEQARRIAFLEQQAADSDDARRQDAAHFRKHLSQIAALEARIRWQRRAFIAAGVVWPIVVIALWSLYAP